MTQELGAAPQRALTYEVVLVTYRSCDLAATMFERLPEDVHVVVVDNSKGVDGIPELVASRPGRPLYRRGGRRLRQGGERRCPHLDSGRRPVPQPRHRAAT